MDASATAERRCVLSGPDIGAIADRWHAAGGTLDAPSRRAVAAAVLVEIERPTGPRPGWLDALYAFDESIEPSADDIRLLRDVLHDVLVTPRPAAEGIELQHRVGVVLDELLAATTERRVVLLETAALVDPLTGLPNRRAGEDALARAFAHARRHGRRLAVAVLDLDGLKTINDTQGHLAGDLALQTMATALAQGLRGGDSAYRFGGDEFVVVAPDTSEEELRTAFDRVAPDGPRFSVGIAELDAQMAGPHSLIAAADERLYLGRRESGAVSVARRRRRLVALGVALLIGMAVPVLAEVVRRADGISIVGGARVMWGSMLLLTPFAVAGAAASRPLAVAAAVRRAAVVGTVAALAMIASLTPLGSSEADGADRQAETPPTTRPTEETPTVSPPTTERPASDSTAAAPTTVVPARPTTTRPPAGGSTDVAPATATPPATVAPVPPATTPPATSPPATVAPPTPPTTAAPPPARPPDRPADDSGTPKRRAWAYGHNDPPGRGAEHSSSSRRHGHR